MVIFEGAEAEIWISAVRARRGGKTIEANKTIWWKSLCYWSKTTLARRKGNTNFWKETKTMSNFFPQLGFRCRSSSWNACSRTYWKLCATEIAHLWTQDHHNSNEQTYLGRSTNYGKSLTTFCCFLYLCVASMCFCDVYLSLNISFMLVKQHLHDICLVLG